MINKLDKYDPYDLLWASVKYDDLLQHIFQNIILIELGKWAKPLYECTEEEARLYIKRRAWLIKHEIVNEDNLRSLVINLFLNPNK